MSYTQPQQAGGGAIEITAKVFPLQFLLYIFKPRAAINGQEVPISWGATSLPVAPGRYQVDVWVPYLFYRYMGRNSLVVDVQPGTVVHLKWRTPWLMFIKGPMSITGVSGAAGASDPGAYAPTAAAAGPGYGNGYGAAPTAATAPAAGAAAGAWHPDPAGRHELRYFDGASWTEHVSDQGVASTDPVPS